jgi:DTW domain-containing protein YfiP
VVFLQHPREAKVAVGTARMAHLSLPNSELHQGVDFEKHPALAKFAREDVAVLYPGEAARPLREFVEAPPRTLIVVDGTWPQARKVIKRNPILRSLPQIAFTPRAPGNYRIRKEPAAHCVSTIEAVAEVLGALERDPARFTPLLRAFDAMVDRQLTYVEAKLGPPRKRRERRRQRRVPEALEGRYGDLVLVHGEANAQPLGASPLPPELVQLVAFRPSTGETFEAFLTPRRPLANSTPYHLGVDPQLLLEGAPVADALARFSAFCGARALFGAWGHWALDLLAVEGFTAKVALDLRQAAADALGRNAGGAEPAAKILAGGLGESLAHGRAGVRLGALAQVTQALRAMPR